jgi:hypothetical protein
MKPRQNVANSKTSIANIESVPCGGGANGTPGPVQHNLSAGDEFEVVWIETIDHPAKYLIDITSQNPAEDPLSTENPNQIVVMDLDQFYNDMLRPQDIATRQDRNSGGSEVENPNPNALYRHKIKIPDDVSCEKCTLRLMQKMFDSGTLRTTLYSHCTDMKISAKGTGPGDDDGGGSDSTKPKKPSGLRIERIAD